jgi:hypothetical protein
LIEYRSWPIAVLRSQILLPDLFLPLYGCFFFF